MEYLRNKKATFEYHLDDTIEAGVALLGTEVKSVKAQHGSLSGAYISIVDGNLVLLGAHIPAWQEKNAPVGFDPYRTRQLLVHKKELINLEKAAKTKGLTLIPISLYGKGTGIKVQVAVARGKKAFDKRETLKKRDLDREARRGEQLIHMGMLGFDTIYVDSLMHAEHGRTLVNRRPHTITGNGIAKIKSPFASAFGLVPQFA